MLKLGLMSQLVGLMGQPPSGGCVLKPLVGLGGGTLNVQPPSGGCVLKLLTDNGSELTWEAAAFGRLCVETIAKRKKP